MSLVWDAYLLCVIFVSLGVSLYLLTAKPDFHQVILFGISIIDMIFSAHVFARSAKEFV